MTDKELILTAISAREKSWSPYSAFMVGAALLSNSGTVYSGCNIENASYSPTNCAERTAFFKAVSDGTHSFSSIAIAGWHKNALPDLVYPCGVCLQVMLEFCDPDQFRVIVASDTNHYRVHLLKELIPFGFSNCDLTLK